MALHGVGSDRKHFNDWPNEPGLENLREQEDPVQLKVSSQIPPYTAGVLYCSGPGGHQIDILSKGTFEASHWFDEFAKTHRLVLASPKEGEHITDISYTSCHTCSGIVKAARRLGKFHGVTFGRESD